MSTSFHESGHAIVLCATKGAVDHIKLVAGSGWASGACAPASLPPDAVGEVAYCLAGAMAANKWNGDYDYLNQLGEIGPDSYGELDGVEARNDMTGIRDVVVRTKGASATDVIQRGAKLASALLDANWRAVCCLANRLAENGYVDGEEVHQIYKQCKKAYLLET